ncbi:alkaline phosphatase family protein [Luteimicrobium sp. DT211]|uniref:alkaline phosphatase family protein n=1 Tax=Luteimicrobium sp. DT211 TaxID=3393412 RepID=UPI003CE6F150
MPARPAPDRSSHVADLRESVWSLVATTAGLAVALLVVPGVSVSSPWSVLLVGLVVTVGDALVRPALRVLAARFGPLAALLLGLAAQVAVAWAALVHVPGLHLSHGTDVVPVLLVAAVVMAAGRWLLGLRDNDYVLGDLRRRARRGARRGARRRARAAGRAAAGGEAVPPAGAAAGERGVLIVQLDGLAQATLAFAVQAGLAPTLTRWLREGSHRLEPWWAEVPSTTPASQAGLLHGAADRVPAFRWWDRELGRLVVTNHPRDAALVEERLAEAGPGLLAGGGVAVSTMFSGGAATSLLVVSRARRGLGPGATFVEFCSSPFVLARALLLTVGELVKELYQGWQQTARRVEPRVSRLGAYPALRAITNVLLRDLNTSLVAEQMVQGAPVIFVDFVDHDEIAHHAGPLRPESLRSLEGLDRVVGLLERFGQQTARPYDVVVLSDHGQSLGEPFAKTYGLTLEALVRRLAGEDRPGEASSPDPGTGGRRAAARRDVATAQARGERGEQWHEVAEALRALSGTARGHDAVGPEGDAARRGEQGAAAAEGAPLVVAASGNFAGVWVPGTDGPLPLSRLVERWPDLVPGLAAHPGVGVVVGRDDDGRPVALGAHGLRHLVTGVVEGLDPTAAYGPRAAPDLARAAGLDSAADLLVVSSVDDAGLVHPFEGLVGSHGGLGGEQNRAVLLHPASWEVDDALRAGEGAARQLVGADAVHRQLVGWLAALGLGPGAGDAAPSRGPDAGEPAAEAAGGESAVEPVAGAPS